MIIMIMTDRQAPDNMWFKKGGRKKTIRKKKLKLLGSLLSHSFGSHFGTENCRQLTCQTIAHSVIDSILIGCPWFTLTATAICIAERERVSKWASERAGELEALKNPPSKGHLKNNYLYWGPFCMAAVLVRSNLPIYWRAVIISEGLP